MRFFTARTLRARLLRLAVFLAVATLGQAWRVGTGLFIRGMTGIPLGSISSMEAAAGLKLPTLVAHGTADKVIPLAAGEKIYRQLTTSQKRWVEIPGADHPNVFITDFPLYATLAEWILTHGE